MPPHLTTRLRSFALALSASAALTAAAASPAFSEEPTPQAINAHAEFLAYPTTPPRCAAWPASAPRTPQRPA